MSGLTEGTWILVTDSEKALFLRNETDEQDPYFVVVTKEEQENPPNRDQAANRRGRMSDGPSGHRSAIEGTDWHELAKERFASDLAEILYKRAHDGAFDRLVVVADPITLGSLRSELHQIVNEKIIAEVPKTLTNHPVDEIEKIVVDSMKNA